MSGVGTLAKVPSNKVGKWVVLALWVIAVAVLAPLAGKLTSVQNNQAQSWLPGDAESTKVIEVSERFRSTNEVPIIVVYDKPSGLNQADLSTIADQAKRFRGLEGVNRDVVGPIPSEE